MLCCARCLSGRIGATGLAATALIASALLASTALAVPLNQVQILMSHNSYHVAPPAEFASLEAQAGEIVTETLTNNNFTHPGLDAQLTDYGVRAFELDVWQDSEGGKYAFRAALAVVGLPGATDESPEMNGPGFKVFHLDTLDFDTTCKTLTACLEVIKAWSTATPDHFPALIKLELKAETVIQAVRKEDPAAADQIETLITLLTLGKSLPEAEPVTAETITSLFSDTLTVLGADSVYMPDDLRGDAASLKEAMIVQQQDWPDVDNLRGKFVLLTDLGGSGALLTEIYGPDLEGMPAFIPSLVTSTATSATSFPDNVVFLEMDPAGDALAPPLDIESLVAANYMVIARADKNTAQASATPPDTGPRDEVIFAGAQIIMTDYVQPHPDTGYQTTLPCSTPEQPQAWCSLAALTPGPGPAPAPVPLEAPAPAPEPTATAPSPVSTETGPEGSPALDGGSRSARTLEGVGVLAAVLASVIAAAL